MAKTADPVIEDILLQYEVEQFLYKEANALDERRYSDWLTYFSDDASYWMPVRSTRLRADVNHEFSQVGEAAFFDDDRAFLEMRILKLESPHSWSEDPPSRTRHNVTNVSILEKHADAEITVRCNFSVYRSRLDTDVDLWVGYRLDRLRRNHQSWQIARREIYLDQTVLTAKNLSTLF